MPSVNIRERDLTSSTDTTIGHEYGVVIPVNLSLSGLGYPKYIEASDLTDIGTTTNAAKIVQLLFQLGAPILVVPVGAESGQTAPTASDFVDKNQYEFRFMIAGDGTTGWSDADMTNACAKRGDAIALLTSQITEESGYGETGHAGKVVRTGVTWEYEESVFQYAASFVGGVSIALTDTTTVNAVIAFLDCFYTYLAAGYPEWFAFAGFTRGKPYYDFVASNMIGEQKITEAYINSALQPRPSTTASGHCANVYATVRPAGDVIWGNRTTEKVDASADGGLKAKNFLNIRNLCCTIKKVAYNASKKYTFEPNSDVLWANWTGEIIPTLEKMRANQGIRGYKITRESVKGQKALIVATITIAPIEAVEDFDITIDLVNSVE